MSATVDSQADLAVDSSALSGKPEGAGERLHPYSFLFVLIAQLLSLWPFLIPLLVAGQVGKTEPWEIYGTAFAAIGLPLYSLIYTLTFRYWVLDDKIVVKNGYFDLTLRHVPFARIHNVSFRRNPLHRIFGVVELNLESGNSPTPEARLTVLTVAKAAAIEQRVRERQSMAQTGAQPLPESERKVLHRVPWQDLIRLGLIDNRGIIVIGAGFYLLNQSGLFQGNIFKGLGSWVRETIGLTHGPWFWAVFVALSLLLLLAVIRLLSIVLAIYSFHRFELSRDEQRLRSESGLLTRSGGQCEPKRILNTIIIDGWLYRWFGRQSVKVLLAGAVMGKENAMGGMTHLTPVATPEQVRELTKYVLGIPWQHLQWQPLAANAKRRLQKRALIVIALLWLAPISVLMWKALWDFALLAGVLYLLHSVWGFYLAKKNAEHGGFCLHPKYWLVRTGYFSQSIQIIARGAVQAVQLSASPFDRRAGHATVTVDLMTANPFEGTKMQIRYIDSQSALALYAALRTSSVLEQSNERAASKPGGN